ncbi:DUF2252 domain-containing protein [Nocardia suismassiliense]|uniref:DUF2252 domain-containing protein n=1 Tax=Nocardia suismassiliense TaxID=2077092 RepID=UPI0018FE22A0|nr:DUF2252 domain-containing protein [Nocardia suismassiliense]
MTTVTTAFDSAAAGRATRQRVSRSSLGVWQCPPDREDPIAILEEQVATRLPDLVPIRFARMAAAPFPFLRGAAAIMAADLAYSPNTGLTVQLCGDAHVANFEVYASPERTLVLDITDFDETLPGPFEWDVKRLAASLAISARANGFGDDEAERVAFAAGRGYRETMNRMAELDALTVWYYQVDAEEVAALVRKQKQRKEVESSLRSARHRTSLHALNKLTEPDADGIPRIKHQPPLLVPFHGDEDARVARALAGYRKTLPEDRRVLLDRYALVDVARKVVGVGSVGTRCYVGLFADTSTGSPLFLQVKEAEASVLARHLSASKFKHQGHRVVHGQQLAQTSSDILLGWAGDAEGRFYYWRQLRDMKGSPDIAEMSRGMLRKHATLCGHTLARSHARTGDRVAIAAYLGTGDSFDRAMAEFALAYADQTEADHKSLSTAIESGRVAAAPAAY